MQLKKEKTKLTTVQEWIRKKQVGELEAGIADGSNADLGPYEVCRDMISGLAGQSIETLEASLAELEQSVAV